MEYWVFIIINVIIGNFLASIDMAQGTYISFIFFLAIFLPTIALTFRRLHDTGRKGWLALPLFIAAQWLGFFLEAINAAFALQLLQRIFIAIAQTGIHPAQPIGQCFRAQVAAAFAQFVVAGFI